MWVQGDVGVARVKWRVGGGKGHIMSGWDQGEMGVVVMNQLYR